MPTFLFDLHIKHKKVFGGREWGKLNFFWIIVQSSTKLLILLWEFKIFLLC